MTAHRLLPAVFLAVLLAGCSGEPEENVFQSGSEALGKAGEVDALLEDAADAQRRAIDQQGR